MDLPVDGRGARGCADSPESTIPELKPGVIVGGHQYPPREQNINQKRQALFPDSLSLSLPLSLYLPLARQHPSKPSAYSSRTRLLTTDNFSPTMAAPAEPPRYVYKIVDTEPPFPIPDVFPPSELDKNDGFIHLSAPWQVSQASQLIKPSTSASASASASARTTATVQRCIPVCRPPWSSAFLGQPGPARLQGPSSATLEHFTR